MLDMCGTRCTYVVMTRLSQKIVSLNDTKAKIYTYSSHHIDCFASLSCSDAASAPVLPAFFISSRTRL
jgi:hypothetical protein